jgi:Na+/H+ antiporter NhaC
VIKGDALALLLHALAYNFYAFFAVAIVLFTILKPIPFPAITPIRTKASTQQPPNNGDPLALLLPTGALIGLVFMALYITGHGNLLKGSGSTSVFYAVLGALFVASGYALLRRLLGPAELARSIVDGIRPMIPITAILLLAFAIGDVTAQLHTGAYLAQLARTIEHAAWLPAGIFLLSAAAAFATGTSWGTFSIMMPIAIALTAATPHADALMPLSIAAVISGGVFGDHASPISDTTIIASLAAGCDLVAHVKTQLPWALLAATFSLLAFGLFGFLVSK